MSEFVAPMHWKPKVSGSGTVISGCWTTPGGFTVMLSQRPHLAVAVIRAGEAVPFAYVQALDEVPVLIAADLYASMSPAFKKAFDAMNRFAEAATC